MRMNPRVSLPAAPASVRHEGEYDTYFSGKRSASTISSRWEAAVGLRPPLPDHDVFGLRLTDGDRLVKDVRDTKQQIVQLALDGICQRQLGLGRLRHLAQPRLQRFISRPRELF